MVTVRIETVTPQKATKWLDTNVHNRKLRSNRVTWLVGIIERGEWQVTNDCIAFGEDGVLQNGQHRLAAIRDAAFAVPVAVMRGLPAEAQDAMDTPLTRRAADALQLKGEHRASRLAAALVWLERFDHVRETGSVFYHYGGARPTIQQLLRRLDAHPDIRDSIKLSERVTKDLKLRTGLTAALHFEFNRIDHLEAQIFFDQLATGAELKRDDAVYHLRRLLIIDAGSNARMVDYRFAALTIKAWNYWRDGKPIQQLTWKYGGSNQEAFPIPR